MDSNGFLKDPFSLSFQIFDTSDAVKEVTPVQSYPVAAGTKQVVDLVAHKLGTGRFAAVWDSSGLSVTGRFVVKWFYKFASADAESSWSEEFEVVPQPYSGSHYCSVFDIRDEGVSASVFTDRVVQQRIALASAEIERYTGRQFSPVYKALSISGRGTSKLQLDEPICAVEQMSVSVLDIVGSVDVVAQADYSVANRHLTEGLVQPDDRNNPKLEWIYNSGTLLQFPSGRKNIALKGVFGYTEKSENFVGVTPMLIRHLCKAMTVRNLPQIGSGDWSDSRSSGRVIRERTREQEIQFESAASSGRITSYTGDSDLDGIIASFRRPPKFGSA